MHTNHLAETPNGQETSNALKEPGLGYERFHVHPAGGTGAVAMVAGA